MEEMTGPQPTKAETGAQEEASQIQVRDLTWVVATLIESLILLGGLAWAISAPDGTPLTPRILLVVAVAVLGAAGFALALAARFRPRD